jgi:hypothetical protein
MYQYHYQTVTIYYVQYDHDMSMNFIFSLLVLFSILTTPRRVWEGVDPKIPIIIIKGSGDWKQDFLSFIHLL